MGGYFSITHWLILLVVVVVVFGTSKLKNIGKDVGSAVKGFKDAVHDETVEQAKNSEDSSRQVIDHQESDDDMSGVSETKDNTNIKS